MKFFRAEELNPFAAGFGAVLEDVDEELCNLDPLLQLFLYLKCF